MENKEIIQNEVENIIELNNVGMEFFVSDQKIDNLKEFFIRLIKGKEIGRAHV